MACVLTISVHIPESNENIIPTLEKLKSHAGTYMIKLSYLQTNNNNLLVMFTKISFSLS